MLSFYEGFEFNFLLRLCPIYITYIYGGACTAACVWRSQNNCVKSLLAFHFTWVPEMELRPLVLPAPLAFCFLHLIVYFMC